MRSDRGGYWAVAICSSALPSSHKMIALGLYAYLVLGLIIATALDRYFMREKIPYGWAPAALPLKPMRTGVIIGFTIVWPVVFYAAIKGMGQAAWHEIQVLRRAKRIYGHRS